MVDIVFTQEQIDRFNAELNRRVEESAKQPRAPLFPEFENQQLKAEMAELPERLRAAWVRIEEIDREIVIAKRDHRNRQRISAIRSFFGLSRD